MSNPKDNVKNFLIRKYFLLCTQEKVSDLITQECIHKNSFDAIEKFLPWRIKLLDLCKIMGITRAQLKKIADSDPTFPHPQKDFTQRRAGVYYDTKQIETWLQNNWEINAD